MGEWVLASIGVLSLNLGVHGCIQRGTPLCVCMCVRVSEPLDRCVSLSGRSGHPGVQSTRCRARFWGLWSFASWGWAWGGKFGVGGQLARLILSSLSPLSGHMGESWA